MPDLFGQTFSLFSTAFSLILSLWWLWLLVLLVPSVYGIWVAYVREAYRREMRWSLLELRMPRELRRTPKAMEQVLEQLYTLYNEPPTKTAKYIKGEITEWFSLEIISKGGQVRFFVRVSEDHRNVIESFFYGSYPEIEIAEVSDYVEDLPPRTTGLYKAGIGFFGIELNLKKEDHYPIRTYPLFEHESQEEGLLDPISELVESLSKLKGEEQAWMQILIKPTKDGWKTKGEEEVQKLKEERMTKTVKIGDYPVSVPATFGPKTIIEGIERKLSKPGFETLVRFIYFAPKSVFGPNIALRGISAHLMQFSDPNLNSFNRNYRVMFTWGRPYVFKTQRTEARQEFLYYNYRNRAMPELDFWEKLLLKTHWFFWPDKSKTSIMNTEEIATIFHPPSFLVLTAPFIKREESKRLGPPAGLPVFESEEDIGGLFSEE